MLLCVWVYEREHKESDLDGVATWAMTYCLRQTQLALIALVREFPNPWIKWLMRCIVFPTRLVYDEMKGNLPSKLVKSMFDNDAILNHITDGCYLSNDEDDSTGRIEGLKRAFNHSAPSLERLRLALGKRSLNECFGNNWFELVELAAAKNLSQADCAAIKDLAQRCWDVLQVD
jgi:Domain of unknown function (DUF1974)